MGWVAAFSLRHQVSLCANSSQWQAGSHRELLEYLQPGEVGLPKLKHRAVLHAVLSLNCCIKYDQQAPWGCEVCVLTVPCFNFTDRRGWIIKLSGDS